MLLLLYYSEACICNRLLLLDAAPPQGFVRSTTKYWVRAEDVSNVKYHVLQHLPVFQFDKSDFAGEVVCLFSLPPPPAQCF